MKKIEIFWRVNLKDITLLLCLLLFLLMPPALFANSPLEQLKIGVLAKRGSEKAMEKWGAMAQYLTKVIPSHDFTIVPLNFEEVHTSVGKAEIDFLVTNSAYYVLLVENHGLSRIATMRNRWQQNGYQMFGGVIFTRHDNNTINNFFDIENKTFMAVDRNSFGGWLMAWFAFHKNGIDPDKNFKSLVFGTTHDKVVFAVKKGSVDAGTVRTDTLERMAAEGKIDLKDFKIINSKPKNSSFPFLRSTDLYPEWPFAKLSHTSNKLAEQVTIALLNMPAQSPAAVAAKITGWTIPQDHDRLIKNIQSVLEGSNIGGVEYTARRSDNTTFPVVIHSNLVTKNAKPIGLRGLLIDITERKKMETDLKRRALAIDHSSDTIVITDIKGIITYVNPAFEKITGYSSEEALGKNPRMLQSGNHDKSFYKELWKSIANGKTWSGRLINKKKAGSHYTEDATISPVFSDTGAIINYVAVKRDVSENLILATRLRQSQKMEPIGTLAGGIAHDFNNILSGIFAYSQLAEMNIKNPGKATAHISQIVKGAQRAAELVQQILTFSRQTEYQKHPLKFYLLVKEVLKLLHPSIPATIDIKENIDSLAMVFADPSQMHQVVMNLCTNAYHAMDKKGGILTVKLSEIEILQHNSLHSRDLSPGIYLKLEIKDTGHGMDKKTLEKAFDPYFTTKKDGKGTGFGLSLVQAIVEEHNGYVHAYSEIDKGSIFHVYLPIVEEKTDFLTKEQKKEDLTVGTGKIMVVDDEESIRIGTQKFLKSCGHQVSSFSNGIEAFQEFKRDPYRFDLIITDMTMPKMTGLELSEKILNIQKDMPIILSTGYDKNLTKEMVQKIGIRKYIQKPIMTQKLLSMIREILNKKEV